MVNNLVDMVRKVTLKGGYSSQSWISSVKLIEKAVSVNLHREGGVTFP